MSEPQVKSEASVSFEVPSFLKNNFFSEVFCVVVSLRDPMSLAARVQKCRGDL